MSCKPAISPLHDISFATSESPTQMPHRFHPTLPSSGTPHLQMVMPPTRMFPPLRGHRRSFTERRTQAQGMTLREPPNHKHPRRQPTKKAMRGVKLSADSDLGLLCAPKETSHSILPPVSPLHGRRSSSGVAYDHSHSISRPRISRSPQCPSCTVPLSSISGHFIASAPAHPSHLL